MNLISKHLDIILYVILVISIFSVIYIIPSSTTSTNQAKVSNLLNNLAEKAYSQGQVDAMNGDIRFDNKHNCWIKSPWNTKEPSSELKMCK